MTEPKLDTEKFPRLWVWQRARELFPGASARGESLSRQLEIRMLAKQARAEAFTEAQQHCGAVRGLYTDPEAVADALAEIFREKASRARGGQ